MAAAEGAYGAPSYDRTNHHAKALVRAVELYMPDAAFFTRDDLMYLPTFSNLALITRYAYVCEAVRYAIDRGWMIPVSRTQLVLAGKKRQFLGADKQAEQFINSISRLLPTTPGEGFDFSDVLEAWTTDTHLTTSAKRTILRDVLKWFIKQEVIEKAEDGYTRIR